MHERVVVHLYSAGAVTVGVGSMGSNPAQVTFFFFFFSDMPEPYSPLAFFHFLTSPSHVYYTCMCKQVCSSTVIIACSYNNNVITSYTS